MLCSHCTYCGSHCSVSQQSLRSPNLDSIRATLCFGVRVVALQSRALLQSCCFRVCWCSAGIIVGVRRPAPKVPLLVLTPPGKIQRTHTSTQAHRRSHPDRATQRPMHGCTPTTQTEPILCPSGWPCGAPMHRPRLARAGARHRRNIHAPAAPLAHTQRRRR